MGGMKVGVLGFRPPGAGIGADDDDVLGAGDPPGPIGIDDPVPLDGARIIANVDKDWDPPKPDGTPEITVRGSTLADVGQELNALDEWGQAGGSIRAEEIPVGTSTNLTIKLHAGLVYRLPTWTQYSKASSAAKAAWDVMFAKLKAHEDRHLAIAIEEANRLAKELIGKDIAVIGPRVTVANRQMFERQKKLDGETDHGARVGVQFGDVILDTSVQ
jgi:hypothetical protein